MTLPSPKTKAPWLGLPIDVLDRNGDPIHIGDVLHFDSAGWGSDDEYFCVEFRQGQVRHPGSIGDLSAWCVIVRKWDAGLFVTSPCCPDGRFATLISAAEYETVPLLPALRLVTASFNPEPKETP
jgi:hypothetical protein